MLGDGVCVCVFMAVIQLAQEVFLQLEGPQLNHVQSVSGQDPEPSIPTIPPAPHHAGSTP